MLWGYIYIYINILAFIVLKIMEFSFVFGYLFFGLMEWRVKDINGTQTFCVNFNQVILVQFLAGW